MIPWSIAISASVLNLAIYLGTWRNLRQIGRMLARNDKLLLEITKGHDNQSTEH